MRTIAVIQYIMGKIISWECCFKAFPVVHEFHEFFDLLFISVKKGTERSKMS